MKNGVACKSKQAIDEETPPFGLFRLSFNNRKRHGRFPVTNRECEGTLYSNGHVNLDTTELPVHDFLSFSQMREYVESWGDCSVEWMECE